ncbi:MAG: phosphatase PAP2 family protein [Lachnospiraceae bacterium]
MDYLLNLDSGILLWIQEVLRNDILTPIFIFITKLGNGGILWIVISILLLFSKKTRTIGFMSLLSLAASALIVNVCLKNLVARVRPYEVITGLKLLVERQSDFSFPSGHAASSFASASIFLWEFPKKIGIPFMILAGLIAFSRLYVGVHYPLDVLAGILIGVLLAWIVKKVCSRLKCQE